MVLRSGSTSHHVSSLLTLWAEITVTSHMDGGASRLDGVEDFFGYGQECCALAKQTLAILLALG